MGGYEADRLRGVIDPVLSIGDLVEKDRPAAVHAARTRRAERSSKLRAGKRPPLARDMIGFAIWGAALVAVLRVATKLRRPHRPTRRDYNP